ncbi:MAG: TIGR03960 family B12-binding radical SAM protein [Planctomycetota bacterium]|jgi:radical SAM family uncharacterized protein
MAKKSVQKVDELIEQELLNFVRKPGRYIGGEINQVKKDLAECELTVALCFPDVYEVASSYTGLAVLYEILNSIPGVAAERVFAPWTDAEELMRKKKIPLFSLESKAVVAGFDIVGFSLTNELCYSNMLNMLDLAGLKIRSCQRSENDPLIVAGGGMSNCCEPVAEFVDLFVLGQAEGAIAELTELIRKLKKNNKTKKAILLAVAKEFDWAYVPSFYEFGYEDGQIKSFEPREKDLLCRFKNAVADDFDKAPAVLKPIVPFVRAVHERVSVEIMRGCPGRCLFCQASFCRRPIQYRSIDKIIEIAKTAYHASGFDTVSLLSLSTADYPQLEELIGQLHEYFRDKHVGLSLPSLRVDQQLRLLARLVTSVRKSGLTIAVEAASERLREIINKPLKDNDLFAAVEAAYRAGWQRIKLYFMVGFVSETDDDIRQIVNLSYRLARLRKNIDGKTGQINAAVSWLVPKAHTPFGWLGQKQRGYFEQARRLILDEKNRLGAKFLNFKFHNIEQSILESAIGRGDRRMCDVIEAAWRNGARFDSWNECFNFEIWEKAFADFGMNLQAAAQRQFQTDEILPWEHLASPEKQYLLNHLARAMEKTKDERP